MDVGLDAALLELGSLVRTAAGDQRERRLALPDFGALFLAQRVRDEAEHADAPGQVADTIARLLQHLAHLWAAHQRQREERQCAALGDLDCESRAVGDARHRTLRQREAGAVGGGEGAALVDELQFRRLADLLQAGTADGLDQARDAAVATAEGTGQADALAQREQAAGIAAPADHGAQLGLPGLQREQAALGLAIVFLSRLERGGARTRIDAAGMVQQLAEQPGLRAIEARELVLQRNRQRGLGQQQHLVVEDHACGARHAAGGGGMDPDATLGEHRQRGLSGQFLQQDVAGVFADPAAGFVAAGDDAVEAVLERGQRVGAGDLGQHAILGARRELLADGRQGLGLAGDDQRETAVAAGGDQFAAQRGAVGGHTQADGALGVTEQSLEVGADQRRVGAELQVEQADTAGARGRRSQGRARQCSRGQAEDLEVRVTHANSSKVPPMSFLKPRLCQRFVAADASGGYCNCSFQRFLPSRNGISMTFS